MPPVLRERKGRPVGPPTAWIDGWVVGLLPEATEITAAAARKDVDLTDRSIRVRCGSW
jgi:hypothetical protein